MGNKVDIENQTDIGLDAEFIDAVVTAWHRHPERIGRSALGSGFVKPLAPNGISYWQQGAYLREENIITLGVETLKVGSRIRCRIGEPEPGYESPLALDVEIYME